MFRDFCVWATVIITVLSGLAYVQRAISVYLKHGERPATTADAD